MKSLVLCSGGMKSAFLAVEASKEGDSILLHLLLGSRHEERSAEFLAELSKTQLIKKAAIIPKADPLMALLLQFCYAIPVARRYDCKIIYHGLCRDEFPITSGPACVDDFLPRLQELINMSLPWYGESSEWLGQLEVETPLRLLRAAHVISLGNQWEIPWEPTWSCVHDGDFHCGVCSKCKKRKIAFVREGSEDLTIYRE